MLDGIAEPMTDGSWVNAQVARIVEIIRERYPDLDVAWIPRDKRAPGDAAFAIIEHRQGQDWVAFYVQEEKDFDERVLDRIRRMDLLNKNPQTVMQEAEIRAHTLKLMKEKQNEEALQDKLERHYYRLASRKHYYKDQGKTYHL